MLTEIILYFSLLFTRNMENIWICKPFNLARGIDIYVTDNLSQIIRVSTTRSMVSQ